MKLSTHADRLALLTIAIGYLADGDTDTVGVQRAKEVLAEFEDTVAFETSGQATLCHKKAEEIRTALAQIRERARVMVPRPHTAEGKNDARGVVLDRIRELAAATDLLPSPFPEDDADLSAWTAAQIYGLLWRMDVGGTCDEEDVTGLLRTWDNRGVRGWRGSAPDGLLVAVEVAAHQAECHLREVWLYERPSIVSGIPTSPDSWTPPRQEGPEVLAHRLLCADEVVAGWTVVQPRTADSDPVAVARARDAVERLLATVDEIAPRVWEQRQVASLVEAISATIQPGIAHAEASEVLWRLMSARPRDPVEDMLSELFSG